MAERCVTAALLMLCSLQSATPISSALPRRASFGFSQTTQISTRLGTEARDVANLCCTFPVQGKCIPILSSVRRTEPIAETNNVYRPR